MSVKEPFSMSGQSNEISVRVSDNGKSDRIVWVIDIPIDLLLEIEIRDNISTCIVPWKAFRSKSSVALADMT